MKNLVLFIILIYFPLSAQINIILPDSFQVIVNDEVAQLSQTWYDSLKSEVSQNKIHYQIGGYHSKNRTAVAKLRIPQTLSFKQVIRQVIYYYSMLDDDIDREKEKVLIYPFFTDIDEPEFANCIFSDNIYYFYINKWKTESLPSNPTPEEKYIYNLILKYAFQNTLIFEEVPENALKEVSLHQNKSTDEIYHIYKKVALWNTLGN